MRAINHKLCAKTLQATSRLVTRQMFPLGNQFSERKYRRLGGHSQDSTRTRDNLYFKNTASPAGRRQRSSSLPGVSPQVNGDESASDVGISRVQMERGPIFAHFKVVPDENGNTFARTINVGDEDVQLIRGA